MSAPFGEMDVQRVAVDLSLAEEGYIRAADGRLRWVEGLGRIARDTARLGVRVNWGAPPEGKAGCSYLLAREIVLAQWVMDRPPAFVRDVWSHELGHCVVGPSCERARGWQQVMYGDLLPRGI